MPESVNAKREKIAILGGGMAALTAAFELSRTPELRARYDITVYQTGWRLGGKGASGRNAAHAHRIEEHGLHILMGFYHNTFRVLRGCYEELGREPGSPLATIEDAIKPHGFVAIAEQVNGRWEPWPLSFPPMPGKPGDGDVGTLAPLEYMKRLLAWAEGLFARSGEAQQIAPGLRHDIADVDRIIDDEVAPGALPTRGLGGGSGDALVDRALRLEALVDDLYADRSRHIVPISAYLYLAQQLGELDLWNPGKRLAWLVERFRAWLGHVMGPRLESSTPLRRLWIVLDLALTAVIGVLKDDVAGAPEGWSSLDDVDLRDWLARHGASEIARESAPVRSIYNLVFSAPGQIAAGTLIHGVMRMTLGYKEAIFQKMQAGMGDVIFAPLYLVLSRRGVKFEFFHRVDELVLSPEKKRIAAIKMGRQVFPKGPEYDPLYDVDGLPCWPSTPLYERIEGGEALRQSGQNLESRWNTWPDAEARRLELGRDFDRVVLGIAIGAFPEICGQLIDAHAPFAAMVANIKTTETQAVQLWMKRDLAGLGWTLDSPVLDGFAEPFDTWADMSHLLPRERWSAESGPRHIAYLCSRLPDDTSAGPAASGDIVAHRASQVRDNTVTWLRDHAGALWPGTADARRGGAFDWSLLFDAEEREGEARLDAQYWQATFCPSERYVLGVPGSTRYRLRAHESGFENLVLAGDWVRTGMNAGCVEAAVMAGLQASRAICGEPAVIPGDE
ncbi:NAD(P)-binding protein [Sorangium sp. So ce1099]|uniref:NAD(P)-binding protein n=1 Tax=Sorangium sp. So ce1099 TaxID=3133331 RepID=UPI003F638D27